MNIRFELSTVILPDREALLSILKRTDGPFTSDLQEFDALLR